MNSAILEKLAGEATRARGLIDGLNREAELQESGCPELCPQERAELFEACMRLAAALGPRNG